MNDKLVRVIIDNEEVEIWSVSEEQLKIIKALEDIGAFRNNVYIASLHFRFMN